MVDDNSSLKKVDSNDLLFLEEIANRKFHWILPFDSSIRFFDTTKERRFPSPGFEPTTFLIIHDLENVSALDRSTTVGRLHDYLLSRCKYNTNRLRSGSSSMTLETLKGLVSNIIVQVTFMYRQSPTFLPLTKSLYNGEILVDYRAY